MQTYLEGQLAPVPDEIEALDLEVVGTLPPELTGRYFRNGPNPKPGQDRGHWFTGDGMIHGVRLRDGRAEWYRNRWVRTTKFVNDAPYVNDGGAVDLTAVSANTHVIRHADKILALVENGLPYELTPALETVGPCDFNGKLTTAMTAHPKEDPRTGELHLFGYGVEPPYLTYHRLAAAGELVESREIAVPGPTMMHDFAITEHYLVWLDLPVVFDMALLGPGMPYRWDDGYGARIGVMPRSGDEVRWFEVDPCYVFHVGNARENAANQVVLDAVRYSPDVFVPVWSNLGGAYTPGGDAAGGTLHRWTFDLASGAVKEEVLDDRSVEFPTINDAHTGLANDYVYAATHDSIVKYDVRTGSELSYAAGARTGEAVFVPAGSGAEDEGWLLSITNSEAGSDLLVLNANDLTHVASVRLPRRVPAGFHGSWLAD